MIRSAYIKFLADINGVKTTGAADEALATSTEAKLRQVLEEARFIMESSNRERLSTRDFNAAIQALGYPKLQLYSSHDPLTMKYRTTSTYHQPHFPLGHVFASNTTKTLRPSPQQATGPSTTVCAVDDIYFSDDPLVSVNNIIQNYTTTTHESLEMSIAMHYLALDGVQPQSVMNPTQDEISRHLDYLVNVKSDSLALLLTERANKKHLLSANRSSWLQPTPQSQSSTTATVGVTTDGKVSHFDYERALLRSIPIPVGAQVVLIKQEGVHSLTYEQHQFLQQIFTTLVHGSPDNRYALYHQMANASNLTDILPYICKYIADYVYNLPSQDIILYQARLLFAISLNTRVSLEPYLHQILATLLSLLVAKSLSSPTHTQNDDQNPSSSTTSTKSSQDPSSFHASQNVFIPINTKRFTPLHFEIRRVSAVTIYSLISQFQGTYPSLLPRILSTFVTLLSKFSVCTVTGCLTTTIAPVAHFVALYFYRFLPLQTISSSGVLDTLPTLVQYYHHYLYESNAADDQLSALIRNDLYQGVDLKHSSLALVTSPLVAERLYYSILALREAISLLSRYIYEENKQILAPELQRCVLRAESIEFSNYQFIKSKQQQQQTGKERGNTANSRNVTNPTYTSLRSWQDNCKVSVGKTKQSRELSAGSSPFLDDSIESLNNLEDLPRQQNDAKHMTSSNVKMPGCSTKTSKSGLWSSSPIPVHTTIGIITSPEPLQNIQPSYLVSCVEPRTQKFAASPLSVFF